MTARSSGGAGAGDGGGGGVTGVLGVASAGDALGAAVARAAQTSVDEGAPGAGVAIIMDAVPAARSKKARHTVSTPISGPT
ncbi:hypothetical protein RIF23_18190 [Lipingzhangella sp. LS1_29]|uniref:Uncharacterized protein n=1 Tax=Lipingzhangella rawalii TaxID=2055835 RepID=A0ABU2HAE8_9ACTN|nr:hypothetical protein [Lipingzhangella rawalii]MDS1272223.1 hypothetical protein [Lipingzhangella rawalii]